METSPPSGPAVERGHGENRPDHPVLPAPPGSDPARSAPPAGTETLQPAKVLRIRSMVKELLDEVRTLPLDESSRRRLREIHDLSVREVAEAVSGDIAAELDRMTLPFDQRVPSQSELLVAQAQLVGWLEGLFHGIEATLVAQELAIEQQLAAGRRPAGGPEGEEPSPGPRPDSRSYL